MNCTPPWLHENKNLWCQNVNIGQEENDKLNFLLQSIKTRNAKKGKCLPNCRSIRFWNLTKHFAFYLNIHRYVSTEIGENHNTKEVGLAIHFDKNVLVTRSAFTIDIVTLITRIGGIIGVGKELLWVIVFCMTTLISVFSKIKNLCC